MAIITGLCVDSFSKPYGTPNICQALYEEQMIQARQAIVLRLFTFRWGNRHVRMRVQSQVFPPVMSIGKTVRQEERLCNKVRGPGCLRR